MITNKIKMVVFDMAGTTINEQNVVYKTLHKAINEYGIDVNLDTVLSLGAGKEKHQAIKDVLAYLGKEQVHSKEIFEQFKIMLDKAYESLGVTPIKGVEQVMLKLKAKNIIVVLNTGYDSRVSNILLTKINWTKGIQYDTLITADDVTNGRPHPDMIQKAMQEFEIKNATVVLKAGDSAIDIEEGKNANCGVTVGVLSGAQTKVQLKNANPTYILNSLENLLDLDLF